MRKLYHIVIASVILASSCSRPVEQKEPLPGELSPDALGWTDEKAGELLNECYLRYKDEKNDDRKANPEAYCNCLIDKITMSIKYEDHLKPTEKTNKEYEQFSKTCTDLTSESL